MQNDMVVITGYDMKKVASLHAVDLQIDKKHIVAEDACTANKNLANIAMTGVTRWQYYLYSYKSKCMGVVQPLGKVSLVLFL